MAGTILGAWQLGIDALGEEDLAYSIQLGGTTIDEVAIVEDEQIYRIGATGVPSAHGGIASVGLREFRRYTVIGRAVKGNLEALRDYQNSLRTLFTRSKNNLTPSKLIRMTDGRYTWAYVEADKWNTEAQRAPNRSSGFKIPLVVEPFWYAQDESFIDASATASPHDFVVTNGGDIEAPPIIELTAIGTSASDMRITNLTTGETLHYTGTIAAGKKLVLDAQQETATANNFNDLSNLAGFFWDLEPGNNTLRYQGDVQVDIRVRWNDRY